MEKIYKSVHSLIIMTIYYLQITQTNKKNNKQIIHIYIYTQKSNEKSPTKRKDLIPEIRRPIRDETNRLHLQHNVTQAQSRTRLPTQSIDSQQIAIKIHQLKHWLLNRHCEKLPIIHYSHLPQPKDINLRL